MSVLPPDDDRTMLALPDSKVGVLPNETASPGVHATDSNTLRPGHRVFEFEILRVIGAGGFGIVYLAYDHSLQRNVAIKEYMPSSIAERTSQSQVVIKSERHAETFEAGMRSFINEARLLAQFDHPSLVKVYRFWEANKTAYMVMPFYEGLTLKQTLQALPAPPDEAWLKQLIAPLLDALETLHQEQCFHRDIAPDNILMLADGRPLLLDFGAARRAITGMDQAFTVILKPGYAPIEQYADVATLQQGAWTDVYALASVVHFAMVGHPPPPSVTRTISDTLVPLSKVVSGKYTEAFLQVLDRCLNVQPKDRPESVASLRAQLQLESYRTTPKKQTKDSAPRLAPATGETVVRSASVWQWKHVMQAFAGLAIAGSAIFFLTRPPATTNAENKTYPGVAPAASAPLPAPASTSAPVPEPRNQIDAVVAPAALPLQKSPAGALAILEQIYEARDHERAVTVSLPKPRVRIGKDRLQMSVSSSRPGYVYLLMVGTNRSDFTLLFPNAVDKDNRIGIDKPLNLPRKKWHLGAFGPVGTDHFVVIVSERPRRFSDAGLQQGNLFAEFPPTAVALATATAPGSTPMFAGKVDCPDGAAAKCDNTYGAAQFAIEEFAAK